MRNSYVRKLLYYGLGWALALLILLCNYVAGCIELRALIVITAASGLLFGRLFDLLGQKRAGELHEWKQAFDQETLLAVAAAIALLLAGGWSS